MKKIITSLLLLGLSFNAPAAKNPSYQEALDSCQPTSKSVTKGYWTISQNLSWYGKVTKGYGSFTTFKFFNKNKAWAVNRHSDGTVANNSAFHRLIYSTNDDELTIMTQDRKVIGKYKVCRQGLARIDANGAFAKYSDNADEWAPIDDSTTNGINGKKLSKPW